MSPLKMEIVMFYVTRLGEHPFMVGDAPFRERIENELLADELLVVAEFPCDRRFEPTERARAYIELLEAMPLPVQKWVLPT